MCGFSWPEVLAESHGQLQASLVIIALLTGTQRALKPMGQAQLHPAAPGFASGPACHEGYQTPGRAARDLSVPKCM